MRVTTEWKFRKQHLNHYSVDYFKNDWDYFIYLHLNDHVRKLHLWGTIIGTLLFPWAAYRLYTHGELIPILVFIFFYYAVGFISHYSGDGQFSQTWRQILQTYRYALKLNVMSLLGKYPNEEKRFCALYPETLWVYIKSDTENP